MHYEETSMDKLFANAEILIIIGSKQTETVYITIHSAIELTEGREFKESNLIVDPFKSVDGTRFFSFFVGNDNDVKIIGSKPLGTVNAFLYTFNSTDQEMSSLKLEFGEEEVYTLYQTAHINGRIGYLYLQVTSTDYTIRVS